MAIDVQVWAQSIILGAHTLPDANATLKAAPGAPLHLSFNLGLPGQTRLRGDGDLETGPEPKFRGDVAFSSADFALLRDWAAMDAPPAVAKVAAFGDALPYRSASLSGAVEASPTGFSGRNLKLTLDRTTLTGALAFKGPAGGEAGRLDVDLASDSLDVEALPSLAAAKTIGDLDLSLSLRAGSLHIARVAETEIDSGSLAVNLTKTGPNVTLKRLSVTGLDGASLDIQGAFGRDFERGDRPFTSRSAARLCCAGFASGARGLEPDAGRTGGRAFTGGADLRRSWRGGGRWRRSRHRLAQSQWIGG